MPSSPVPREAGRRLWRPLALAALALAIVATLTSCGASSRESARAAGARAALGAPAGAGAPAGGGSALGARGARARPNFVFVLTDDLAWNLVRFMPHVLAMQRAGATFTNYFVTDSLCCPSRASIFTGRFPHNTRVFSNTPPEGGFTVFKARGEERETFAVALQRAGYRTALMGKYLNEYRPAATPETGPTPYVPPGWSTWDVAGNGYPEYGYTLNANGFLEHHGYRARDYLTNVLAGKALRFIDGAARQHRPFMLEVATFAPHSPFTPAPRDALKFPLLRAPRSPAFNTVGLDEPSWLSHFEPLLPGQIALIDKKFRRRAQAVQAVDRMLATIEGELAARGLAGDTYIVFSSDNGLHMGEHRLLPGKQTAFDSDIKVPLIVTGPDVPPGRTLPQMTENVDLFPTFEQLAGLREPLGVDGHTLGGLLRGEPIPDWRREILVEHHQPIQHTDDPDLPTQGAGNPPDYEALRSPESLYVEYGTGEREYYDLRKDPFELRNLASELSPAHALRLHATLLGVEACRGEQDCWRAQHGPT